MCTLFVLARMWSRLRLLGTWFPDDTLIVLAWVFSTAVCVVYSIAAVTPDIRQAVVLTTSIGDGGDAGGGGGGLIDYDAEAIQPYMLRTYLGLIFYQLCLCLTKLSILAFYLRMFYPRPLERRLAWATVAFVLAYGVPLLAMSIFQCHPAPGQFFGAPMRCFGFTPLLIASASLHTATDAWLIVMVIPCIIRLDLPPRQKLALAVVLSLSIFVIAASLTRLQLSLHANYRPAGSGVQVANTLGFFVMTILECDIALICASAPTLRPLIARLWPKMGMGEPVLRRRSRRRRRRISRFGLGSDRDDDDDDDNSVNLTTVVSYHGYPWVERRRQQDGRSPSAPPLPRSKSGSLADVAAVGHCPPAPPAPAFHRTPTTLSLRSFMSSMAPRSRGVMTAGGDRDAEDRANLLDLESRRSSVGFEGYHDQYLGYGEEKKGRSRSGSKLSALGGGGGGYNRWTGSQESFVLGLNDPASPTRMSPVSPTRMSPVSGFSGTTFARTETQNSRVDDLVGDDEGADPDHQENDIEAARPQ